MQKSLGLLMNNRKWQKQYHSDAGHRRYMFYPIAFQCCLIVNWTRLVFGLDCFKLVPIASNPSWYLGNDRSWFNNPNCTLGLSSIKLFRHFPILSMSNWCECEWVVCPWPTSLSATVTVANMLGTIANAEARRITEPNSAPSKARNSMSPWDEGQGLLLMLILEEPPASDIRAFV